MITTAVSIIVVAWISILDKCEEKVGYAVGITIGGIAVAAACKLAH